MIAGSFTIIIVLLPVRTLMLLADHDIIKQIN